MPAELIPLACVVVGERHRQDLGDIEALVASIDELGLLQPIGVTPDRELLFGRRRLEACRQLGWKELPAIVLPDLDTAVDRLKAERDENVCRKQMVPSELVAIGTRLEAIERPAAQARKRTGKTIASRDAKVGKTDEQVAGALGMSTPNYRRAKRVVEAAEDETLPDKVRSIAQQARSDMDATGKPWRPYRKVQDAKAQAGLGEPRINGASQENDRGRARQGLTPARFIERVVKQLRVVLDAAAISTGLDLEGHRATNEELEVIAEAITQLQGLQTRLSKSTKAPETATVTDSTDVEPDSKGSSDSSEAGGSAGIATTTATQAGDVPAVTSVTVDEADEASIVDTTVAEAFSLYPREEPEKTLIYRAAEAAAKRNVVGAHDLERVLEIPRPQAEDILGMLIAAGVCRPKVITTWCWSDLMTGGRRSTLT